MQYIFFADHFREQCGKWMRWKSRSATFNAIQDAENGDVRASRGMPLDGHSESGEERKIHDKCNRSEELHEQNSHGWAMQR